MKIDELVIEGIANIGHANLKLESMNALIAPNGYEKVICSVLLGLVWSFFRQKSRNGVLC